MKIVADALKTVDVGRFKLHVEVTIRLAEQAIRAFACHPQSGAMTGARWNVQSNLVPNPDSAMPVTYAVVFSTAIAGRTGDLSAEPNS